jgi:hypothetical protein
MHDEALDLMPTHPTPAEQENNDFIAKKFLRLICSLQAYKTTTILLLN